jgi:hypothetical protein
MDFLVSIVMHMHAYSPRVTSRVYPVLASVGVKHTLHFGQPPLPLPPTLRTPRPSYYSTPFIFLPLLLRRVDCALLSHDTEQRNLVRFSQRPAEPLLLLLLDGAEPSANNPLPHSPTIYSHPVCSVFTLHGYERLTCLGQPSDQTGMATVAGPPTAPFHDQD